MWEKRGKMWGTNCGIYLHFMVFQFLVSHSHFIAGKWAVGVGILVSVSKDPIYV
jgi:hypothetical protein